MLISVIRLKCLYTVIKSKRHLSTTGTGFQQTSVTEKRPRPKTKTSETTNRNKFSQVPNLPFVSSCRFSPHQKKKRRKHTHTHGHMSHVQLSNHHCSHAWSLFFGARSGVWWSQNLHGICRRDQALRFRICWADFGTRVAQDLANFNWQRVHSFGAGCSFWGQRKVCCNKWSSKKARDPHLWSYSDGSYTIYVYISIHDLWF